MYPMRSDSTPLSRAIHQNDVTKLRELLTLDKTLLEVYEFSSCSKSRLLTLKSSFAKIDNWSQTPLMNACYLGKLDIVKCMIEEFQANVNFYGNTGYTPLMWACAQNHFEVVQYLVENAHADIFMSTMSNKTALSEATTKSTKSAIYLIDRGAPIDTGQTNLNTLILAASGRSKNKVELIKRILETGKVDVNTLNNKGETALMLACDDLNVVKYLIESCHANVNIFDKYKRSVIDWAFRNSFKSARYVLSLEFPEGIDNLKTRIFEYPLFHKSNNLEYSNRADLHFITLRLLRYGSVPFTSNQDSSARGIGYFGEAVFRSFQHRFLLIVLTSVKFHPRLAKKNTVIRMMSIDLIKMLLPLLVPNNPELYLL